MDMLSEDALRKMDEYACDETARKFTLRDIVNQLTHEYRTLQQQITKESERAEFWQKEQLEVRQANLSLMQQLADVEEQNAQILAMVAVVEPILAESIARTIKGVPQ